MLVSTMTTTSGELDEREVVDGLLVAVRGANKILSGTRTPLQREITFPKSIRIDNQACLPKLIAVGQGVDVGQRATEPAATQAYVYILQGVEAGPHQRQHIKLGVANIYDDR